MIRKNYLLITKIYFEISVKKECMKYLIILKSFTVYILQIKII